MGEWIDFKEIREKVTLEDVLFTLYHFDGLRRSGSKVSGPCPIHRGDNPRAFQVDLTKNAWFCHTKCKRGGNAIDFAAAYEKIGIRDAALKLKARFVSETPSTKEPAVRKHELARRNDGLDVKQEEKKAHNPPISVTLELKFDHPHLVVERGLARETVEAFGVGYCGRGILRGMIGIPIHNSQGQLVAYAGRRLKPDDIRKHGKYKLPGGFEKSRELYNYHRAKEVMAKEGLILVEGYFAVLKLFEYGFSNVVAAMGTAVSSAQLELLAAASDVTILFDGDDAGWTGGNNAYDDLKAKTKARLVQLPEGIKADALEPRASRWALNGVRQLDLERLNFCFRTT